MQLSLAIYLPDFAGGGAERVYLNLAPELARHGFAVTFVVHERRGELTRLVPPATRIVPLRVKRTAGALLPLVGFLRREKPDILLSGFGPSNILALWAAGLARSGTRVVVSQHSSLLYESRQANWQWKIMPSLYRRFLARAAGVVAVSAGVADELAEMARLPRARITVIYNPVITADFDRRLAEAADHPWLEGGLRVILGLGRLVAVKDFETLLAAFAALGDERDLRLIILGDGPRAGSLARRAAELGIAERVSMPGFVANPLPYLRRAVLFVSSSRVEGFGNALVEALACGTPVVSTSCPFGPAEILDNGRFGRLVP
ncbi:MAG TPA: glycosyltransferase, partial [Candidatus Sulfotelmatobacter sp.]|nr:glycosyltransferase [Candidatus Sulfotelmatobacter sp.]